MSNFGETNSWSLASTACATGAKPSSGIVTMDPASVGRTGTLVVKGMAYSYSGTSAAAGSITFSIKVDGVTAYQDCLTETRSVVISDPGGLGLAATRSVAAEFSASGAGSLAYLVWGDRE